MEQNVFLKLENKVKAMKRRRRWMKIVSLVACLSFVVTISALTLPAISQSDDTFCGKKEHTHIDECYETVLLCGVFTQPTTQESSTGPPEEAVADAQTTVETVTVTDVVTTSTAAAEEEQTEMTEAETDEEGITESEVTSAETVSDETEAEAHKHTADCYEKQLICETEEHTHSVACTSDTSADTETKEDWDEMFSYYQYTDIWSIDLLSVAEMQLGYRESTKNFIVDEDGITVHGYTRYGDRYGNAYGEWANAFVLFSMEYAKIDIIPNDMNIENWISVLKDESNGLFREINGYIPTDGDLIFLDSDEDGTADLAGIVAGASSDEKTLTVIEGDVNGEVAYTSYEITDSRITGFAQFSPEQAQGDFETNTFSLVNVSGTGLYHSPDYLEYQYSAHKVNNYMTLTYVLIPYEDYTAGNWEPNLLNWSADSNANYVVAYCADRDTDVSESGEYYTALTIFESDYSEYAEVLAGIVQHSYPFITADEMRAELVNAYERGEISVDLSCCKESDFIAAAQWAIWDMTRLSGTQTTASGYTFPSYNKYALNPLSDPGHTDSSAIQSHVKAIRDWLVTQTAPLPLDVSSNESVLSRNEDGTYNITVTVTLSRPLDIYESVYATFTAGDKSFEKALADEGIGTFTVELTGLTVEEVLDATAELYVTYDHLQVYVYDSGNYQDMISGQWGRDEYSLTFELDIETTSVDVTKYWSDDIVGAESISVQLFADGKEYGEPIELSAANNWTYTWEELLKYSEEGVEIEYTVSEQLIPGYYSSISKTEGGKRTVTTLENVSGFTEGGQYLLVFNNTTYNVKSAITDFSADGSGLDWTSGFEESDAYVPPAAALWSAAGVTTSGSVTSAYLQNVSTGKYMSFTSNINLTSSRSSKVYFYNNYLYFTSGSTKYYLSYFVNGIGYVTSSASSSTPINLYKYTQTEIDTADISFTITNTKTENNTSVSVEKIWTGRNDGLYPDSVTVMLLRNGEPYGSSVVLSNENNWKYEWEELPLTFGELTFSYSVEESEVEGYYTSIRETANEDGTFSFAVTNNWNPEYVKLKLQKTDYEDPTLLLSDAVFEIYRVVLEGGAENSVTIPGTAEIYGILEQTVTSSDSGETVPVELLVGATYYLIETQAPSGYNILKEPLVFVAGKDTANNAVLTFSSGEACTSTDTDSDGTVLQVKNTKGYVLPETGGSGTVLYYLAGILLIILTAVCFISKTVQNNIKIKRRKKS